MPSHQETSAATRPVGIWLRVSTEDQAKGESPAHHEKRARAYAEVKGWNVIEVYHLEGVSGKAVMHNPEAKRMLADLKANRIRGLIFSKLARLARNTKELLEFADIFREYNGDLISLGESIDTSTPAGRLFYTMIAAMAAWEREEIASRVAVSVPIRAKLGKSLGGTAPYGWRWQSKKLVLDPLEGPIRRQVYELFAEHKRKRVVAKLLNAAGHRTRDGVLFTHTFVNRILRDPASKGMRRVNYTTLSEKNRVVIKPEKDWITNLVPPVVSEELWDRCNAIMASQQHSHRPVAKRTVQIFAGITFCTCGAIMYVPSNTPKYVCQKCRTKIPIVDIDEIFHEQLRHFLLSPEELTTHLNQADEGMVHKQEVLDVLLTERKQVGQGLDRVFQLYTEGRIGAEMFSSRYAPLEVRSKQLDEEIPRLQAELDYLKISQLSREELLQNAKNLYDRWPTFTNEEKRQVAETITQRITVGEGEVSVELCYLPSAQDMAKGDRSQWVSTHG